MNFTDLLSWISGKKPETKAAPSVETREKRRFYRINLSEGEVFLGENGPFSLVNVSYGGVRVKVAGHELSKTAQIGQKFDSRIKLGRIQFSCSVKVCNLGKDEVGCAFENLAPAHSRMVSEYLRPRILGSSLQEINASSLQNKEPNLRLRWFQGDEGAQIFLWQTLEGDVVKEEFYFFDYIITWDHSQKVLQTGALREEFRGKGGFGRIDQSAIAFFKVPSHRALKMGRVILESASLPLEAKGQLLSGIVREERRLFSRFTVAENDRTVRFTTNFGGRQVIFPVANLSLKGVAFPLPENFDLTTIKEGDLMDGQMEISGRSISMIVKVVFFQEEILGGTLDIKEKANVEFLAAFLAPRLLGQSLEEVPAPTEIKPVAPSGSRSYLHVGVHNTHLLSLVAPQNRLIFGRIAFMDFALVFERNLLSAYSCPRGFIFPNDWELPLESVEKLPENSENLRQTCVQMLENAKIPDEVRNAWKSVFSP